MILILKANEAITDVLILLKYILRVCSALKKSDIISVSYFDACFKLRNWRAYENSRTPRKLNSAPRIRADLVVSVDFHDLRRAVHPRTLFRLANNEQTSIWPAAPNSNTHVTKFREHYTSGCGISDSRFIIRDS